MGLTIRAVKDGARGSFHRLWPELRRTSPGVLFVVGLGVAGLVGYICGEKSEDQIRYAGTALQIAGIALVAVGVHRLRRDFKRPGVFSAMANRIAAIFRSLRPRHHVIVAGTGHYTLGGATVEAHGRVRGGTIEQQIDGLYNEADALRERLNERARTIEASVGEVRLQLGQESQERNAQHTEITRRLDVAVGGLHLEIVGLWWLLLSTLATGLPQELAGLF